MNGERGSRETPSLFSYLQVKRQAASQVLAYSAPGSVDGLPARNQRNGVLVEVGTDVIVAAVRLEKYHL